MLVSSEIKLFTYTFILLAVCVSFWFSSFRAGVKEHTHCQMAKFGRIHLFFAFFSFCFSNGNIVHMGDKRSASSSSSSFSAAMITRFFIARHSNDRTHKSTLDRAFFSLPHSFTWFSITPMFSFATLVGVLIYWRQIARRAFALDFFDQTTDVWKVVCKESEKWYKVSDL